MFFPSSAPYYWGLLQYTQSLSVPSCIAQISNRRSASRGHPVGYIPSTEYNFIFKRACIQALNDAMSFTILASLPFFSTPPHALSSTLSSRRIKGKPLQAKLSLPNIRPAFSYSYHSRKSPSSNPPPASKYCLAFDQFNLVSRSREDLAAVALL